MIAQWRETVREFGMHTAIFQMDNKQGPTV